MEPENQILIGNTDLLGFSRLEPIPRLTLERPPSFISKADLDRLMEFNFHNPRNMMDIYTYISYIEQKNKNDREEKNNGINRSEADSRY